MEVQRPATALAPRFEWITTPSWILELAPMTIGLHLARSFTSSARITA